MHEEIQALEDQRRSLQLLVGELLLANQKLRLEIVKLTEASEPAKSGRNVGTTVQATHPQLLPGH